MTKIKWEKYLNKLSIQYSNKYFNKIFVPIIIEDKHFYYDTFYNYINMDYSQFNKLSIKQLKTIFLHELTHAFSCQLYFEFGHGDFFYKKLHNVLKKEFGNEYMRLYAETLKKYVSKSGQSIEKFKKYAVR